LTTVSSLKTQAAKWPQAFNWGDPQHLQYTTRAWMHCKAEPSFYFYCTNQSGLIQSKEGSVNTTLI